VLRRAAVLAALLALGACKSPIMMTKPGVTPAQAERDQKICQARADDATRSQPRSPRDNAQIQQRVLLACLRGMGYEVKDSD